MWWSTLTIAIREIRRNAMRSALTILGIVIGVAAVIAIVTLGAGASAKITAEISSLGENLLIVSPERIQRGRGGTSAISPPFTLADVAAIRREIADVRTIVESPKPRLTLWRKCGGGLWGVCRMRTQLYWGTSKNIK